MLTVSTKDTDRTVKFEYTAEKTIADAIINGAIEYIYNKNKQVDEETGADIPFETLTNDQKLEILDNAVKKYIQEMHRANESEKARLVANQTVTDNTKTF